MPSVGVSKKALDGARTLRYIGEIDQCPLAVTNDSAAKGSVNDLEVVSVGPVHSHFLVTPFSLPCVVPNIVFQVIEDVCSCYSD